MELEYFGPRTYGGFEGFRWSSAKEGSDMIKFLLWCLLFVVCWPLALLALVLYPIVWLILLPFRLIGITLEGVFELIGAIILLPARLLRSV